MRISILIPTYRRPDMLSEALSSALSQTLPGCEIIVSDDSPDTLSEALVKNLAATSSIPLRYFHHTPSLKQAANVDFLLHQATGTHLCLLHDDDLLEPTALEELVKPFAEIADLTIAYGKQRLIREDGTFFPQAKTDKLNHDYHRTSATAGLQSDVVERAVTQQIPNDGYLVRADAAQAVGYNHFDEWGEAIDQAFGINLAFLPNTKFYYVDKYTARYRICGSSESNHPGHCGWFRNYKSIRNNPLIPQRQPLIVKYLKSKSPVAIGEAIELGLFKQAWAWYWDSMHRSKILTLGGLNRLCKLIALGLKKLFGTFKPL